jgi:pimeloyl-ACP methyl ester carboxylesterase
MDRTLFWISPVIQQRSGETISMANIVLVHGSWLGGWCWDTTATILRDSGHQVFAEDLPGHGQDTTPAALCTLDAYIERVCSTVKSMSEPVVLVGHSMGGIVISGVGERLPKHISELVYVAAYLLRDGESIKSISASIETDSIVRENMVPAADWSTVAIRKEGLKETFFADCSEEEVVRASSLMRPEPTAAFLSPVEVTASRFGSIPRTYIRTTRDRALTPKLQNAMLASTPCPRVLDIETSHCPMMAAPDRLNALLSEVVC